VEHIDFLIEFSVFQAARREAKGRQEADNGDKKSELGKPEIHLPHGSGVHG